jgi:hypothetical protein
MEAAEPGTFAPTTCSSHAFYGTYINNKLDLLFVIDDSSAMAPYQDALQANAPVFMNILLSLAFPVDLQIAVAHGSNGVLADPAPCGVQGGARFLEDSHHDLVKNFTGALPDAFACLAQIGTNATVPGQPLAATLTALTTNSDFLRDTAYFLVVIIAPQDDMSPQDAQTYANEISSMKPAGRVMASVVAPVEAQKLRAFVNTFGPIGVFTSIDQASWASAFSLFARISGLIAHRCIDGVLAQPVSCTFRRVVDIGTSMQREIGTLPTCDPASQSTGGCVALVPDGSCAVSGVSLSICYNGFNPADPMNCPDGPNEAVEGEVVVSECAVECN